MPVAKKQYNKKTKQITLAEFRAWLEGVEELQPKSWVPDATQWKLIRNKIKCIIEPEPERVEVPVAPSLERVQQFQTGMIPSAPTSPPPQPSRVRVPVPEPSLQPGGWESVGLGDPNVPTGPTGPSALDGVDKPAAIPTPPAQSGMPAGAVPMQTPNGTVTPGTKTPDIDTSNGTFESQFS